MRIVNREYKKIKRDESIIRGIMTIVLALIIIMISRPVIGSDFNIDKLDGDFIDFMKLDEEELNNEKTIEEIEKEIIEINKELVKQKKKYETTKSGAILYGPEVTGNIHALNSALENRGKLIDAKNNNKEFIYNKDIFYTPLGSFNISIAGIIPEAVREFNYNQTKIVLDNIEIPNIHTKNTVFIVSPLHLRNMNGYSYTDGSLGRHDLAVIANYSVGLPLDSDLAMKRVRGTVLHELGHIFHGSQEALTDKLNNNKSVDTTKVNMWKEYNNIYEGLTVKDKGVSNWNTDQSENLAEDFRIYYSSKLGEYSFEPEEKKTDFEYNKEVEEVFKKYENVGKDPGKKSFADMSFKIDGDIVANIPVSTKIVYPVSNNRDKFQIHLDLNDAVYTDYIVYTWDSNNKFIESKKIVSGGTNNAIDLNGKDSNVDVITMAVVNGGNTVQKWRVDIVR